MSLASLQPILAALLKSLPPRPIDQNKLGQLVREALEKPRGKLSPDNLKSQWEYVLKNDIFLLAATEGKALKEENTTYYDELRDKLDVVLAFTEHDACEQPFPFVVLQDLLETQTITSCSHIFSWIEARAARLTEGMVPQKGKALILLRTLNDLLRRLSKMGSTTIFCGRILTFLSGVFPLGERSGVNLRGEYGPTWEGLKDLEKKKPEPVKEEAAAEPVKEEPGGDAMQVDDGEVKKTFGNLSEKKSDFYNTFWSLQLPFSKPPIFINPETLPQFKEAVNKVLPVIKEATAKDRAMMGSRAGATGAASLKRKREPDSEDTHVTEYFFAKFLTSPDLIDLEIADTHFRRQFLFQLLILLNHLLTFTKAAKANWVTPRNRSLQMEFTLEPTEAQWVQETVTKVMEELRQTTPNGRAFAETVGMTLEREKNWVKWKNELCAPFDKEPAFVEVDGKKIGLFEVTREKREEMMQPPADWEWRLGTAPLTEIWEMGCRGLEDLQTPFQPGDVKDFVKKIKQEDAKIDMRKRNLARAAERITLAKARAADAAKAEEGAVVQAVKPSEPSTPAPMDTTLTAPRPANAPASPLHPSLPPKPGPPPLKPSPSQDVVMKDVTETPTPVPAVETTPPTPQAAPAQPQAAPSEPKLPADEQLLKLEENKQRWAWLALRTARDQCLQHFGKIGTGDIELLIKEIEKETQERERVQKEEELPAPGVNGAAALEEHGVDSPMTLTVLPPPIEEPVTAEGDAKMDEG